MKIKGLITVSLVILGLLRAEAQDTTVCLSLKQSCQMGIERNVNVQNAGLEQQKVRFQLKEAQSKLLPQLEAYSNFSYYFAIPKLIVPGEIFGQTGLIPIEIGTKYDWSSGFKAGQVLYNQSYFTSLKLAQRMEKLCELSLQQQKEEVVTRVSQVYFLCQNTSKQIEYISKTLDNTRRLMEISRLQTENGVIRKVDYSRVMVNKNNIQTQIDNLKQLHQQQLRLLKYLIGLDTRQEIALSDSLMAEPLQTATGLVDFSNRSEIQLLEKQMEITLLSRKSNQQSYLPALSGFGQYYYQGQRNEFDFLKGGNDKFYKVGVVGLSLNIPVFDGFEKRAKTRQYDIELMQLQNTRKNTVEFFSKEYTDAMKQYENSLLAMQRQQENIKLAEETYNVSLQGYREQVVSLSDLLLSESSLTQARLSYYNALVQVKNSELELKKAKGELLNF